MKLLKALLCAVLIGFSALAFAASVVEGEPEDIVVPGMKTQGCGYSRPLRVAGMIGNPPFGWVERHDERATKDLESYGLGRAILDKLQKKLGISYVSTGFLSYNRAISALKRGDIDLLLAAYYRPQDLGEGTMILYPGYFTNVFTVYFKKGKEIPFKDMRDLDGLSGIIRREEHIYPLIQKRLPKGIYLKQVSTAKKAYEMLMNEEADYLIGSPYSEEAELRRYKLNFDIVRASKSIDSSNLFFVFTKNSDCWKLSEKFSHLIKKDFSPSSMDRTVRELIDSWGERFREDPGLMTETEEENSTTEKEL